MKGIPVSQGIAIGKAFIYKKEDLTIRDQQILSDDVNAEIQKLNRAINQSMEEIEVLKQKTQADVGAKEAEIFTAHRMILDDPEFINKIHLLINESFFAAEKAVKIVTNQFVDIFNNLEDEYFRERAADIKDVSERLIRNILGINNPDLSQIIEDVIIIAKDLTPSDTAQMNREKVLGFATEIGGKTSHTAIMAKSLEIPAVLGLGNIMDLAKTGDTIIVDGNTGEVSVNPNQQFLEEAKLRKLNFEEHIKELVHIKALPTVTTDGHSVELAGNIGTPEDTLGVLKNGGEGVGLYRTEFLFMNCEQMPSEDIQFEAYKKVLVDMGSKPVIIRTLDIGGDKKLDYLKQDDELNPFLGLRAIRLCFVEEELFKTQLRAILRASHFGNAYIMFPMISSIDEVRKAKEILYKCMKELDEKNISYNHNIKVGIMVEIPSAAITADIIAKEVDFFSIGTNDLCQYTLAVDRMNEKVAYLYEPLHPAVLRLIKTVIDASHKRGIFTGMCGEMAGDEYAAVILLGLGLDEFSMSASTIPRIKKIIRSISYKEAQRIAEEALQYETAAAIYTYVKTEIERMNLNIF